MLIKVIGFILVLPLMLVLEIIKATLKENKPRKLR
jgi:hypothetical protein